MARRTSFIPTVAVLNRDWPHQVALPDDLCVDQNYYLIADFCRDRGLAFHSTIVLATWPDRRSQSMRVHCFRLAEEAATFRAQFGGEVFVPARDRVKHRWRREGPWFRLLESGPLRVPTILI